MISIGIDWADSKHDVCIRDLQDRRRLAEFEISQDAAGVEKLAELVAACGSRPAESLVAIERPDGLLVGYLLQAGYQVYAIAPKAVDRYRDRHRASQAKSDTEDAAVLADILCTDRERHRPMAADSPLVKEIHQLSQQRQKLVRMRTQLKNQLTACLKSYYPVALELFSDLERAICWAFLRTFPNLQAARQVSQAQLEQFFADQRYTCKRKIPAIYQQLHAPTIPAAAWEVRVQQRHMRTLVAQLAVLVPEINALEKELEHLLTQHPDGCIFRSLPNAGVVTAAWLLGEIGDCRTKFENARALQALAGSAPVTRQSHNRRYVKFRTACRKSFRNGLQQFARLSSRGPKASIWAKAYLNDQLARGHSLNRARRALGNRWLVIIYRLWQDGVPYQEAIHLRNRAVRTGPKPV